MVVDKKKLFYTHEEVEKIARRALFMGELFGANKEKQEQGGDAHFPMGEKFEQVADYFLEQEGIHNSLKEERNK